MQHDPSYRPNQAHRDLQKVLAQNELRPSPSPPGSQVWTRLLHEHMRAGRHQEAHLADNVAPAVRAVDLQIGFPFLDPILDVAPSAVNRFADPFAQVGQVRGHDKNVQYLGGTKPAIEPDQEAALWEHVANDQDQTPEPEHDAILVQDVPRTQHGGAWIWFGLVAEGRGTKTRYEAVGIVVPMEDAELFAAVDGIMTGVPIAGDPANPADITHHHSQADSPIYVFGPKASAIGASEILLDDGNGGLRETLLKENTVCRSLDRHREASLMSGECIEHSLSNLWGASLSSTFASNAG